MNTTIYNAQGMARPLTAEEERLIALDLAREKVRKWENIFDAMRLPGRIHWAKARLSAARAELARLKTFTTEP